MSELTLLPGGDDIPPGASPFERIRHRDEHGEHWYGRELQVLMGYPNWRDFAATIGRAYGSLVLVQGTSAGHEHFAKVRKVFDRPNGGYQEGDDYRLTRFGAYLVAMAGDDSKIQVAAARIYFAVQTRQAEIAQAAPSAPALSDLLGRTELSNRQYIQLVTDTLTRLAEAEERVAIEAASRQQAEEQASRLDAQVQRDAPRVEWVERFVQPDADHKLIRQLAQQVGVPEKKLRSWMLDRRLIYLAQCDRHQRHACYRPYAGARSGWFFLKDQPEAPRHGDGSMRQTLMVTAVGCLKIAGMLDASAGDGWK